MEIVQIVKRVNIVPKVLVRPPSCRAASMQTFTSHNTRFTLRRLRSSASTMARSVGRYAPSFPRHCSGTLGSPRLGSPNVANLNVIRHKKLNNL
jgi:hypothetical protein